MSEKKLEAKLRTKVKALGGLALKFVSPGHDGVTDRIVIMPGDRIWFVETKNPETRRGLSPLQQVFKKQIEALGCRHRLVDSQESLDQFLTEIQTPDEI